MDLSLPNNKFCDPKFHTIFLIFMPLILSFEEIEDFKKKNFQTYKYSLSLEKKIILKIQKFSFLLYLVNFS